MTSSRGEHVNALGFAGMQVEEFEGIVASAKEKLEEVLGTVINAVGEEPTTEAGQNALSMVSSLTDKLEEIMGICEGAKAELNRYGGGF